MQFTLPSMTFDRSFIIYRKTRTVELLWLGNAHTNGDVWVFLPKEKILICGDAMHGWTPFMGDSYPYDWIKTLDAAEKLDFTQALGGHGEVMHNKDKFEMWKQYFHDLMEETARSYSNGASLEDAQKQVSKVLIANYSAKFDPNFAQSVIPNVTKAYQTIAQAH